MTNITYINRKGTRYFLCVGKTKLGKIRYYFAREPGKPRVTAVPDGYEIRESINGLVSLVKARPVLILDTETDAVKSELDKHPKSRRYRVDVQPECITIYENIGLDPKELISLLASRLGSSVSRTSAATVDKHAQYRPMLRFLLTDGAGRTFVTQRMCFRSSVDGWLPVAVSANLRKLAKKLVPTLGTDAFYELV